MKHRIALFALLLFTTVIPYGFSDVTDNMAGRWTMDNGAEGLTPAHDGSTQNASFRNGRMGGAMELKGDGLMTIPAHSDFDFGTGSFSASGWIYVRPGSGAADVINALGDGDLDDTAGWRMRLTHGTQSWSLAGTGMSDGTAYVTAATGASFDYHRWYHVAMVYDQVGDTLTLYVDGIEDQSLTTPGFGSTDQSDPKRVGSGNNTNFFDGLIDEIRLYHTALALADVQTLAKGATHQNILHATGPLPVTADFYSNGGPITLLVSGSGANLDTQFRSIGMSVSVDGYAVGQSRILADGTSREAFPTLPVVLDNLAPGPHTITIHPLPDDNDPNLTATTTGTLNYFDATMIQTPLPGSEPYGEADAQTQVVPAMITQNTTLTVGAAGAYADINSALAYLGDKRIQAGTVVTIEVVDALISNHPAITFAHPDGDRISIKGNVPGGANNGRAFIQFANGANGVNVTMGARLRYLDNLVLSGVNQSKIGLKVSHDSHAECGPNLIIENFSIGFKAVRGGTISAGGTTAKNNGSSGYTASENGVIYADNAKAFDNGNQGFRADQHGTITANGALSENTASAPSQKEGFRAYQGGLIVAKNAESKGNTDYHFVADGLSIITAENTEIDNSAPGYTELNGSKIYQ